LSDERQIFTLKQVAQSIQKAFSERYTKLYWVKAEVHKLNYTTKGHCYPELVHKENGSVQAEMKGTIWASNYQRISKNFAEIVKEPIQDGMSLLLLVKIVFHPVFGVSLEISDIDPTFSLGELQKERQETLNRLTKEGLLNNNQKLAFPLLPKRVAIISVDSSKGLLDFYTITKNNPWNYQFFFMLFPAQLNGDIAVNSIISQLKQIEKVKDHFDVVLIIRGGGGEIGLSCYNNYSLSKEIATFPLPIMTGIGHSTNITVSELVAFRSAITPSELADFLIQAFHEYAVPLKEAKETILKESISILNEAKTSLKNETKFLIKGAKFYLSEQKSILKKELYVIKNRSLDSKQKKQNELNQELLKLDHSKKQYFQNLLQKLNSLKANFTILSSFELKEKKNEFNKLVNKLSQKSINFIGLKVSLLEKLENKVLINDPAEALKRGYSITLKDGKIISSKNKVKLGDELETITTDFKITSVVKQIK
jgi:exodeoxyribonuclease VII large subunit